MPKLILPPSNSFDPTPEELPEESPQDAIGVSVSQTKLQKKPQTQIHPEAMHKCLHDIREYRAMLDVSKGNLQQVLSLVSRALSLTEEIEARLRTTRAIKTSDHFEALELANQELTRIVCTTIPRSFLNVSAFVVGKAPTMRDSLTDSLVALTHPPETKPK